MWGAPHTQVGVQRKFTEYFGTHERCLTEQFITYGMCMSVECCTCMGALSSGAKQYRGGQLCLQLLPILSDGNRINPILLCSALTAPCFLAWHPLQTTSWAVLRLSQRLLCLWVTAQWCSHLGVRPAPSPLPGRFSWMRSLGWCSSLLMQPATQLLQASTEWR